jgi:hypothetical protein
MGANAGSPQAANQASEDKPIERASSNSARRNIKRTLEYESSSDDEEQPQLPAVRKSKNKKPRRAEDELVYIVHHVDEPRVGVMARVQENGKVWTQAFQKGGGSQLDDWGKYVTANGQVKVMYTKLDAAVTGEYDGSIDDLPRDKRIQMIKNHLKLVKGKSSDLPAKIRHRTTYEPSQLEVGLHTDGKSLVFARMVIRPGDSDFVEFFLASNSRSKLQIFWDIDFYDVYRRDSRDATKAHIQTFFKAQVVTGGKSGQRMT